MIVSKGGHILRFQSRRVERYAIDKILELVCFLSSTRSVTLYCLDGKKPIQHKVIPKNSVQFAGSPAHSASDALPTKFWGWTRQPRLTMRKQTD